jgi:putative ABC transport system ATP-binding protein
MIELEGVTKEYRSGRGYVRALRDVRLSIEEGTITAITGKSGSGKTTLLNCIGGLETPETGSVTCFGSNLSTLSRKALCLFQRRHVGFVFQHGNLLSYLTVFENIAFPLALNGIEGEKKARRIETLLRRIGLSEAGAALPHELSGGEIQRVSVARAMAHRPKMLLADEPTASLDSDTGRSLIRFLFEMGKEQGCTIVFSTHDHEIIELADTRFYIRDGRLEE